jgi:H+/Cl- antiporter ClcA
MFCGGVAIVAMWQLVGTPDFLGLSLPVLSRSFTDPSLAWYTFALKLAFTVVTLAAGFLGGEVTPLFVIGAALGNALAGPLGLPLALAAGVGMAAMFAAASNTPLALSIMAVELLGVGVLPHVVIVCVVAYLLTGHRSIYPAQRLTSSKTGIRLFDRPVPLREMDRPGAGDSEPPGSTPDF